MLAAVDDVDRLHTRLPKMPICPGCGVIAPAQKGACPVCGEAFAHPRVAVHQAKSQVWVALRCSFQCRSCQFLSPLDELDIDGSVECAQCGQAQRFDVEAWRGALAFAHGVGDLAFPQPEGRNPHPGIWIGADNPHLAVGSTEVFDELRQSSVLVEDAMTIHRSLFVEAAPGHPVCAGCREPLQLRLEQEGVASRCPKCQGEGRFTLPAGADRYCASLAGVVAEAHRTDQRRARMETTADGPISLKCPDCSGPLPATRDRVVTCGHCGVASLIPVQARVRDAGSVLAPDVWWVAFVGVSERRAEVEVPALAEKPDPKTKADKIKAELTDLELADEQPGPFWPQRLLDLALPAAALVVAIILWLLFGGLIPDLPTGP
jgi:hypothetical protein